MRVDLHRQRRSRTKADDVWEGESLLYVLRERMGLPGSKNACEQGECGSCTVCLDGVPVCSCLVAAGQARAARSDRRGAGRGRRRCTRSSRRSSTPAPCSAASAPRACWSPPTTCCARTGQPDRRGDPRGAGGQPVPLHRLREDPGRGPPGRRPDGGLSVMSRSASDAAEPTQRTDRHPGRHRREPAAPRRHRSRSPASSPTPPTCGTRTCCGARRCAARTRTPGSAPSTSARRWRSPACTRCSPTRTCPARTHYGLEIDDQPVLADDKVRYQGEPVALVAADHPETARQAAKRIVVDYEVLRAGHRRRRRRSATRRWNMLHDVRDDHRDQPRGRRTCTRRATWSAICGCAHGDRRPRGPTSWWSASTRSACRTRPSSGPESGLAVPAEDGGVDLYVATQWLHVDQRQICAALGLPPEQGAA